MLLLYILSLLNNNQSYSYFDHSLINNLDVILFFCQLNLFAILDC